MIAARPLEQSAVPTRESSVRLVRSSQSETTSYPPVPESTVDAIADLIIAHMKKTELPEQP